MSNKSTLEHMQCVTACLEQYEKWRIKIDRMRRIDESSTDTLERMIQTQKEVVEILIEYKAPHRPGDYEHKDTLIKTALTKLLTPPRG